MTTDPEPLADPAPALDGVIHVRGPVDRVAIRRDGDSLHIEVADDGIGFDPVRVDPPSVARGGFGLFSIRERLRLLGGVMMIDSNTGNGTRVLLTAPLDE